ncbi:MAG: slipin family protein [candidate division Zixibacteria bacterium]|nr:slipin family protein [candidate division Zixibacteria bacterium]
MLEVLSVPILILVVAAIMLFTSSVKVLREYERGVVFRLGRIATGIIGGNGPGVVILLPGIDKMVKVSLRTLTKDVPAQDVITRDNVSIKVNAVIYFRVLDPERAVIEVEDYLYATHQLAQTTLRSVLGQVELDDLLANREKINEELQVLLDQQTEPWGIKVTAVVVKNVDLPPEMQRAMAKQAEAERERRAKVIAATGEYQAAEKLSEAAQVMGAHPIALQLRYLQTLAVVAAENNSTTLFPIPIDLFTPFLKGQMTGQPAPPPVADAGTQKLPERPGE